MTTTDCYCGKTFTTARGQGVHQRSCTIALAGNAAWRAAVREGRSGVEAYTALARAVEDAKRAAVNGAA